MINAPDHRTFISGLGAVPAGIKGRAREGQPMSNSADLILYRGKLTRDFLSRRWPIRPWLRRSAGGDKHELGQHLTPRQTGLDELVPSRYALKVGAIDVLVVSDG